MRPAALLWGAFVLHRRFPFVKASPLGRGVTKGDGEGKAGSKKATCAAIGTRLYQSDAIAVGVFSLFASLPSQALRASSPKGRAFRDEL